MDFPSNTNKEKEAKVKAHSKKDKVIEKVVTGEVVIRKKSLGTKFKEVFIGGESKAAIRYIGTEVLLPALRNMIVDATTKGIERVIYGEAAPRRPVGPNTRVSYNTPVSRQGHRSPYDRPPHPAYSPASRGTRFEVSDLIFATSGEANAVLERMIDIVDKYDLVSVADMHELAGVPSSHIHHKWGWSDLRYATVQQTRDGFIIEFPELEPI